MQNKVFQLMYLIRMKIKKLSTSNHYDTIIVHNWKLNISYIGWINLTFLEASFSRCNTPNEEKNLAKIFWSKLKPIFSLYLKIILFHTYINIDENTNMNISKVQNTQIYVASLFTSIWCYLLWDTSFHLGMYRVTFYCCNKNSSRYR